MKLIPFLLLLVALPASAQNIGSFSFSFGAKVDPAVAESKSRASENKLAFEDLSGLCDVAKLPEGTLPIRSNAGISDCDIRYLVNAKNPNAPAMSETELNQCSKREFEAKQHELGTEEAYPDDSFKAEEINQKYKPLIEARIQHLKAAKQFCMDTGKPDLMHYDVNSRRTPLELEYFQNFVGFADSPRVTVAYKGKKTEANVVFSLQPLNGFGKNDPAKYNSDRLGMVKFTEEESRMLESGAGELISSVMYFSVAPMNVDIPFLVEGRYFDHLDRAYLLNASSTRLEATYKDNSGNARVLVSNDIIKKKQ